MKYRELRYLILSASLLIFSASAAQAERPIIVRETVGTVKVQGWERNLLKGDPNLKNYHWSAIYSNPQGLKRIRPRKEGFTTSNSSKDGGSSDVRRYFAPKHLPLPHSRDSYGRTIANPSVTGNLVSHDTQANLLRKNRVERKTSPQMIQEATVLTYASGGYPSQKELTKRQTTRTEASVYGNIKGQYY
ncbi:MAG: hypothetical protein IAF58_19515 [Leptolyngbya sp.]|nr:hypothetical protein [Candidatus Melainabacteria bacterium]